MEIKNKNGKEADVVSLRSDMKKAFKDPKKNCFREKYVG